MTIFPFGLHMSYMWVQLYNTESAWLYSVSLLDGRVKIEVKGSYPRVALD